MSWSTREIQARRSIGMGVSHIFDRTMDMTHYAYSAGFGPHDTWCVDPSLSASGDGKTWEGAFVTMTEAIDATADGDTVLLSGTLTEHIDYSSYAAGPDRIHILGVGAGICDANWFQVHTGGVSTSDMIDLQCHGWTFENIRFRGPKEYSLLRLDMPTSAGGAYGTTIKNCWLRRPSGGTAYGINVIGVWDCHIINNDFMIGGDGAAMGIRALEVGFSFPNGSTIAYNRFHECGNQIVLPYINSNILYNTFQGTGHVNTTTKHLDLTGGNDNVVFGNVFGGAYTTTGGSYVAGGNDVWRGNYADDTGDATSQIDASTRLTKAVPAAV